MAATSAPTGKPQHKVYATAPSASQAAAAADLAAAKALAIAANQVIDADPPEFERSGNKVTWQPVGEQVERSIADTASLSDLAISFAITESNSVHDRLIDAEIGEYCDVVVSKIVGAAEAYYYARGQILGVVTSFDTPARATVTLNQTDNWVRFV